MREEEREGGREKDSDTRDVDRETDTETRTRRKEDKETDSAGGGRFEKTSQQANIAFTHGLLLHHYNA